MANETRWKISHSGYANAPFVIYDGPKAPDYRQQFPLQGVNVIAEVPHNEGPRHEDQKRYAKLISAAMEMYTALRRIRSELESAGQRSELDTTGIHQLADTAIMQAEVSL
jgi:hypothetical protein